MLVVTIIKFSIKRVLHNDFLKIQLYRYSISSRSIYYVLRNDKTPNIILIICLYTTNILVMHTEYF